MIGDADVDVQGGQACGARDDIVEALDLWAGVRNG
jgi:hypothetical protein